MPEARLRDALAQLDLTSPRYATDVVERVLTEAQHAGASDVHFQPGGEGMELRWRVRRRLAAYGSDTLEAGARTSSRGSRSWRSS